MMAPTCPVIPPPGIYKLAENLNKKLHREKHRNQKTQTYPHY